MSGKCMLQVVGGIEGKIVVHQKCQYAVQYYNNSLFITYEMSITIIVSYAC